MDESWKEIKGYEGKYEVSDLGKVRNKRKILKQAKHKKGYLRINLLKNGKQKNHRVHRLVAEAFIKNEFSKLQVNHKNGIKIDNRIDNLEWCTGSENAKHAWKLGLYKGVTKKVTLTAIDGEKYMFETYTEASLFMGKTRSYISRAIYAKQFKNEFFEWKRN